MNILFLVYEALKDEDPSLEFKYIPIEGELVQSREILGIDYTDDSKTPTRHATPLQRLLWQTCEHPRFIPWRLSRNLDHHNVLYDLEIKAQIHPCDPRQEEELETVVESPRDPRYGLDFICNPDRSPEDLRQDDELATATYLPPDPRNRLDFICNPDSKLECGRKEKEGPAMAMYSAAGRGAKCETPPRRVHDPPEFQPDCDGPTNVYTKTYPREVNTTSDQNTAVPASHGDPSHQQQQGLYETNTQINESYGAHGPLSSYDQAYNSYGHNAEDNWPLKEEPKLRGNFYCVSEVSHNYEGMTNTDAVSALSVDDYRGRNHAYVDPQPPPPACPVYNAPEPDGWSADLYTPSAEASLMQFSDQYENDTVGYYGSSGVTDFSADYYRTAPNTYDIPRRPVPNRGYYQPQFIPDVGQTHPEEYYGYFRPELSYSEASAGYQMAKDPGLEAQLDSWRVYSDYTDNGHRAKGAWKPFINKGKRATTRLFGAFRGR